MLLSQLINSPSYLYNLDLLEETLQQVGECARQFDYTVHYAIKANNNPVILSKIRQSGFGIDCVSGNEVSAALEAGFDPTGIVFAGVGKTDEEIRLALKNDLFCLNCESLEELEVIAEIAGEMGKSARVALRIIPGIEAHTHQNITTGLEENKFGIHPALLHKSLQFCDENPHLEFIGLHFHIGSQITRKEPFIELAKKASRLWQDYEIERHGGYLLNLGGGLGIDYTDPVENPIPDFREFFGIFNEYLDLPETAKVHFELGRSLVGQCGILHTKVLYVKEGRFKKHIITDAGMTELLRPALYQAFHRIENLSANEEKFEKYDIAGPVCESTDQFAKNLELPVTKRGDVLAIYSCGAYVESMRLNYLLRNQVTKFFLLKGVFYNQDQFPTDLFQGDSDINAGNSKDFEPIRIKKNSMSEQTLNPLKKILLLKN
jgi:diaminopimelate decarboxylase